MHKHPAAALVAAAALLLAGCTQITTRELPKADIANKKHIFVEHRLADSYGVADEIARQLNLMGYDATAGALQMMPPQAELVVSYDDMWTWDFNTYMIEFDVQVRVRPFGQRIYHLAMGSSARRLLPSEHGVRGHAPAET